MSASLSTSAAGAAGAVLPLPPLAAPHGLARLLFPLPSSHRTVPRVSPIIIVLGFAAAGSAGNASTAAEPFGLPEGDGMDTGRGDAGEGLDEEDGATHGVAPTRPAPALLAEDVGIEGNGFAAVDFPQLPCLLTAERDD